ncbi:hypothetical protein PR001_g7355, partial [Phytophthora rubi]
MLLLQMLSLPLSPTLRRHGTDADFVDAHNTEWEVSEEDLLHLSLLHESCVTDTNAVLPWQYGAPGHHRPNGVATNPHEVIHEDDPDLLQKLRQCPDVDIFLPIGLHGNGYCEDAVAYAKYLKSRLLPLWALEVKLFDPEVGHEVDYYDLCPTTPMIFFQHYWDGVPSSPRWPDQKPVYLMPNIEMVELTPEHHWRVDVVLCKIKVCCFLDGLKEAMPDAAKWAKDWDFFKVELRKETLGIIKQRRKLARASYKQRIRRLLKQEERLREAAAGTPATVDSITDNMDVLTLTEGQGGTPLQRVLAAVTACTTGRAAAQQRRIFREGGHRTGQTTRAMFRRVSTKYADNEIHRLDAAIGHSARGVHDKADTLADAWTPIFQQKGSTQEARQEVLQWLGACGQHTDLLSDLNQPFTEAEVAAAVGASKPGKACGPDRLGNDWYRDFADLLTPILTTLFNCWYCHGVFPASFLEADIFCLKKAGESTNPLNFRPLALLDTDYKILTRILATRTSRKLSDIVHPHQNGFVPYRTIHSTIDLFSAAQAAANADPVMERALALLLDFCKAYDSVDRDFLYGVLMWLGCPEQYVQAIRRLHDGTSVRFLANGYKSRSVKVSCGIRQGCPLAPLLFLLVLEALYRRIDAEPRVLGVMLKSDSGKVQLKVGGYADDTASYVRSEAEVTIILVITGKFARASGLRLNEGKTLVIALNPDAIPQLDSLPAPLKVQAVATLSRYLGIPVGSIPDVAYTWQLARTQLVTRLALASRKTMTAAQRSMVVAAVVIPKLLYIGRHQWPTTAMIASFQRMIDNFVWHAQFSEDAIAGRAWLNKQVAQLPRKDGGLAIPNLKLELLAHAAVTVNRWALEADTNTHIVGDAVAGDGKIATAQALYVSPRHTPLQNQSPRILTSLWITGRTLCNLYGGVVALKAKEDMVVALSCLLHFRGPLQFLWTGRRLR